MPWSAHYCCMFMCYAEDKLPAVVNQLCHASLPVDMTASLYDSTPTCCLKHCGYRQCVSLLQCSGTLASIKDSTKAADSWPASARQLTYRKMRLANQCKVELHVLPAMFATSTGDNVTDFCHGVVPSLPSAETFATVIPLLYWSCREYKNTARLVFPVTAQKW